MILNKIGLRLLKNDVYLRHSVSLVHKDNRIQQYKKKKKAAEDKEWNMKKSMNPYASNVGMARQLKSLGLDSSDPVFRDEDVGEFFAEADGTVEGIRDRSRAFRKQYKVDEENQKVKELLDLTPYHPMITSENRGISLNQNLHLISLESRLSLSVS